MWRATAAVTAVAMVSMLAGCGAGHPARTASSRSASEAARASEPLTHQQVLVEQGAPLVVSYGCAACHLMAADPRLAPSFESLAGHRVTLKDGRRVLVDERFIRKALVDPSTTEINGYNPAPMLAAVRRLHLRGKPLQVAAIAAFVEEVGPETQ